MAHRDSKYPSKNFNPSHCYICCTIKIRKRQKWKPDHIIVIIKIKKSQELKQERSQLWGSWMDATCTTITNKSSIDIVLSDLDQCLIFLVRSNQVTVNYMKALPKYLMREEKKRHK